MKIELSTPQKKLKKSARWCGFFGWLFLLSGLFNIGDEGSGALLCAAVGVLLILRRKKAKDTMTQQNAEAEAQRLAEEEAWQKEEEARQARIAAAEEEWQRFLAKNDHVRTIRTKVAGVTFRNSDGSSRQENLSYCITGGPVEFEHFTYKGAPAYSVSCGGLQIGNLPADLARDLYDLPDTYTFMGEIDEVTGGEDGLKYGCNLRIDLYREK